MPTHDRAAQLDDYSSGSDRAAEGGMPSATAVAMSAGGCARRTSGRRWLDGVRRLAEGEPLLALKLNRRLQELAGPPVRSQSTTARRTWAELRETAEGLRQAEERRQEAETEARRIKDLQDFAPRAAQAWRDVQALIEEKKARPYDEAVALLVKLRDLAVFQDRPAEFHDRMTTLWAQYAGRPAFQERLRKVGLA